MDILKNTPNKTFKKDKFNIDLKKNNIVEGIKFKTQNNIYCHKNKNQETVIQLSNRLYAIQPKKISLKRNFFLTLKKNYNNNLLYSAILSKHLYKTRFKHFCQFISNNENKTKVKGRVLSINLFEKFNFKIGILGFKVNINLFELTPRVKRLKNVTQIMSFYFNKVLNFNIKKIKSNNNYEKFEISRKAYFLNNKTT